MSLPVIASCSDIEIKVDVFTKTLALVQAKNSSRVSQVNLARVMYKSSVLQKKSHGYQHYGCTLTFNFFFFGISKI